MHGYLGNRQQSSKFHKYEPHFTDHQYLHTCGSIGVADVWIAGLKTLECICAFDPHCINWNGVEDNRMKQVLNCSLIKKKSRAVWQMCTLMVKVPHGHTLEELWITSWSRFPNIYISVKKPQARCTPDLQPRASLYFALFSISSSCYSDLLVFRLKFVDRITWEFSAFTFEKLLPSTQQQKPNKM